VIGDHNVLFYQCAKNYVTFFLILTFLNTVNEIRTLFARKGFSRIITTAIANNQDNEKTNMTYSFNIFILM
jgi:hypothetical protein